LRQKHEQTPRGWGAGIQVLMLATEHSPARLTQ
jgi:hypothetical protein